MTITNILPSYTQENLDKVLQIFQQRSRLTLKEIDYEIKERTDGKYLIIYLCNPTERFFKILNEALESLSKENAYKERTTLKKEFVCQMIEYIYQRHNYLEQFSLRV